MYLQASSGACAGKAKEAAQHVAGSAAETAEQAKEKLGEAAQKGREAVSSSAPKPVQVGIRAPSTPDHKVGAMFYDLALI